MTPAVTPRVNAITDPRRILRLDFSEGAELSQFIAATAEGAADQLCVFGTRGERKTTAALVAMIRHSELHRKAGFPLPTRWLGVTDTFDSHVRKTCESMTSPLWQGTWLLRDGKHTAEFRYRGVTRVRLQLFGVDSPRDAEKVRAECHGVWFEEPAPAADLSQGISEAAWEIALTSRRLPTHAHVSIATSNYPDREHWIWRRFVTQPAPGTAYTEIEPGTYASEEDRAMWAAAITDDALRARLIEGRVDFIVLGERVATGFNPAAHVSAQPLAPIRGLELWMGHDSGPSAHHHATVIGQRLSNTIRVYAGLVSLKTGLKQHLEREVLPWLDLHAPWILEDNGDQQLWHRYDPNMDVESGDDIDQSPLLRLQSSLGGHFGAAPIEWRSRIGPLTALFDSADRGKPALQIAPGPDTERLRLALAGRWDYVKNNSGQVVRDLPRKPNHPWEDLGDGLCYLVGGLRPSRPIVKVVPRKPLVYTHVLGAI